MSEDKTLNRAEKNETLDEISPEKIRALRALYRKNFRRISETHPLKPFFKKGDPDSLKASILCMIADELEYSNYLKELELGIREQVKEEL